LSQSAAKRPAPPLFPIGLRKLALLLLTTLTVYQFLWFFYHWRYLRDVGGQRVRPAVRSLIAPIFVIPLAWQIGKAAEKSRAGNRIWAVLAAVAWIAIVLLASSLRQSPVPLMGLLLVALEIIPIIILQRMANRVNRIVAPLAKADSRLTRAQLAVVAIGGLLLLAGIVGLFLPPSIGR
jgi:hypothetical protein